jgi:lipopolysaccharide transport system permease protein
MIGETTKIPASPGNAPSRTPNGLLGLYRFRDLLWSWTTRNVRGRYQQSVLGWLWAIIQPVASVLIFTVIFTRFVPVNTDGVPYILFSYTAMVPWTLLSLALTDMSNALVFNMNLVTKIYFPREILPLAAMLARLLDFAIAALLLAVLVVIYQPAIYIAGLPMLPVVLLVQLALITGLGLAFAALNVFYRDVQPFLALGIQLWFYASPIIYPVSAVPANLHFLYFLNPMAGILESYRNILLYNQPASPWLWLSAVVSAILLVVGYWFFKRVEFLFADLV